MRTIQLLPLILTVAASQWGRAADAKSATPAALDMRASVCRINSTQQSWNPWQPWEKNEPNKRRALAAIVAPQRVLTTSELVADATYLEFESADGTRFTPARVIAVDYEANLALLGPAGEMEGGTFFAQTTPFEITSPPKLGDSLQVMQIEENGVALQTPGILQSVELSANFLPGQSFLTYMVKASMQGAAGSYSLPVLDGGKLVGVLISYNSKDQLSEVIATDIVTRFLKNALDGEYKGFPSLGVAISRTEDTSFRQWLKLSDDQGGIFIHRVRTGTAAETAGVKAGDVLLAVDGQAINRRGYYQHPRYGNLAWGHLIRGEKASGDVVTLSLWRDGKPLEIKATLTRGENGERLVPNNMFDKAPNFLVKGGLIFQELTLPILQAFGENWRSRAPLALLDACENPEKYEKSVDRIVFLSNVIPTPATVGYEHLRSMVVSKVNGREIKNMKVLIDAFNENTGALHTIEFVDDHLIINLDPATTKTVDAQLLKRGITRLSHAE